MQRHTTSSYHYLVISPDDSCYSRHSCTEVVRPFRVSCSCSVSTTMESDVAPLSTPDPTGAGTQTAHYAIAPTHPGRTHSLSSQHVSLQRSTGYYVHVTIVHRPMAMACRGPHIKYKCATRIMHTCTCFLIALHTLATDSLAVFRALTVRPGPGRRARPPCPAPGAARSACPVTRDALRESGRPPFLLLSQFFWILRSTLRRHRLHRLSRSWGNSPICDQNKVQKPYVTLTKTGAHTRTLIQTTLHYT